MSAIITVVKEELGAEPGREYYRFHIKEVRSE